MTRQIYLDNGATTKVAPEVAEEINKYFTEVYGNASSNHDFGEKACEALERSRIKIAKALNAEPNEIYFTSGGTESDNIALRGIVYAYKSKGKNHIITTVIEHPAILRTCEALEKEGFEVTYLPVDKDGLINLNDLRKSIKKNTAIVSVMAANNEIGTIQDLEKIGEICSEQNILFHTDSVQAFTKVPIDVKKQKIHLASFSGHKIHGPKGIGAIYIKNGVEVVPLIYGGSQEKKIRPGTENIPGIVGFAKAVELSQNEGEAGIKKTEKLRDGLIKGILAIEGTRLNGHPTKRLCINANISFKGIKGERLLHELNKNGIAASTGSACSAKSSKPSHVLSAIGLNHNDFPAAIRFSLSRYSTAEEIEYAVETVKEIVLRLRKEAPSEIWKGC